MEQVDEEGDDLAEDDHLGVPAVEEQQVGADQRHLHVHLDDPARVVDPEHGEQEQRDGDEHDEEGGGRLLHPAGHRLHRGRHGGDGPRRGRGRGRVDTHRASVVEYL